MSDEDRRDDRGEDPSSARGQPDEQYPEDQRQGYTPVRLAGFPVPPVRPQTPTDDETAEDGHSEDQTTDDLANEPARSASGGPRVAASEREASEREVSTQRSPEYSGDEQRTSTAGESPEGESSDSRHVSAHPQRRFDPGSDATDADTAGARRPGARLVVPASGETNSAGGFHKHGAHPAHPEQQPAAGKGAGGTNDPDSGDSGSGNPVPGDPVPGDSKSGKPTEADLSDSSGATTGQTTASPDDNQQFRDGSPSHSGQSATADAPTANEPVTEAEGPHATHSQTPGSHDQDQQRRSRTRTEHQQSIDDFSVGLNNLAGPTDSGPTDSGPTESGPPEPTSAGRGGSPKAQQPRSGIQPSRPHKTPKARGHSVVQWRALGMAFAVVLVLVAVAVGAFTLWPSSGQQDTDSANQPQAAPEQGEQSGSVRETGIAFEGLSVEGSADESSGDGEPENVDVSLRAAVEDDENLTWTGTAQGAAEDGPAIEDSPQTARSISLSGEETQTSANFQSGFEMPTAPGGAADGELQSGVMARTEAGEPVIHATYQRLGPAEGEPGSGDVSAQGSYYVADDRGVLAEGSYTDRREQGTEKVVRTYTEDNPATSDQRSFRISFEAPPATPIPTLVGWQPPERDG